MPDGKFYTISLHLIFTSYLVALLWVLLFINTAPFARRSQHYQHAQAQLIPFKNTYYYLKNSDLNNAQSYKIMLSNVLGNLAIFIPWGVLAPQILIRLRYFHKLLLSALLLSLTAELLQYIFKLGVFDIDDIILNTTGAVLGYLFLIFVKSFRRNTSIKNTL